MTLLDNWHGRTFTETPTRGDAQGWVDQPRPVAAALASRRNWEAAPCPPAAEKDRALNHGWAPGPPTPQYMCSPHMRFTVADPTGPLHLHDGALCWSPQVEIGGGRVRRPETVAAEAARAGP